MYPPACSAAAFAYYAPGLVHRAHGTPGDFFLLRIIMIEHVETRKGDYVEKVEEALRASWELRVLSRGAMARGRGRKRPFNVISHKLHAVALSQTPCVCTRNARYRGIIELPDWVFDVTEIVSRRPVEIAK